MGLDYPLDYSIKISKRLKLIRQLEADLQRVHYLIGRCDTKASIILASIGVFITVIVKSLLESDSSESINDLNNSMKPLSYLLSFSCNEQNWWVHLCLFFAISLICISFFYLLISIVAKRRTQDMYTRNNCKTYFGDICKESLDDFIVQRKTKATEDDRIDELISQIYVNSVICNKKYRYYNSAVLFFLLGFGFLLGGTILYLI